MMASAPGKVFVVGEYGVVGMHVEAIQPCQNDKVAAADLDNQEMSGFWVTGGELYPAVSRGNHPGRGRC